MSEKKGRWTPAHAQSGGQGSRGMAQPIFGFLGQEMSHSDIALSQEEICISNDWISYEKKIIFYMNYGHVSVMFLDWIRWGLPWNSLQCGSTKGILVI